MSFFRKLVPYAFYKVSGESMQPDYMAGDFLLIKTTKEISIGDDVVLLDPRTNSKIFKRVKDIIEEMYFVEGINLQASTDSRHFGPVSFNHILGKCVKKIKG